MSALEMLEEISEIVTDPDLKLRAIRDRIVAVLADAGYLTGDADEPDEAPSEEDGT